MTSGEALFYRKAKTLEDRWLVDRQGAVLDHVQMSMGASKQRDGAVAAAIAAAEGSPEVEIQRIPLVPEGLPSIDFVAHA